MDSKTGLLQLSVIIVNYNVKFFLEQCLFSVIKACKNIDAEIIVVDNNSTDGSRDYLSPKFSSVQFLWNKENVGFAKANNMGVARATGRYILFLNPDTIVAEDCFTKCISFFESGESTGAIGVRMIDGSGEFLKESKRAFPSPLTSLYKLSGLTAVFPRSKTFARYYLGNLNEYTNHEVDVLAGAFIMTLKKVLDKTGAFDESFFMYGEDVDLSYRIQQAGYTNFYFSDTTIIHFKGESTKKGSLNYVKMFYNAMSLFVKKHYTGSKAGIFNFFIHTGIWMRASVSGIGRLIKRIVYRKPKKDPTINLLVVADKECFDTIISMLKKNQSLTKIIGRIQPGKIKENDVMGYVKDLPQLIRKHKVGEIIFCEDGLSFKEIINVIQQLPGNVKYMFHAKGSDSIVSSDSKNESGEYLSN